MNIDVADDTLFDVCWKLTNEIVQCTDAECMDYVQQRIQHNESLQGACEFILLELDEVLEVLDKDEEVEARTQQDKARGRAIAKTEFSTKLMERKQIVKPAVWAAEQEAAKKLAKERKNPPKKGPRSSGSGRPWHPVPDGAITQSEARILLPPGASVWKANIEGCWMGHFPPFKRVSKSWRLHGHREAALEVVKDCWRKYAEANLVSVEAVCNVLGLF